MFINSSNIQYPISCLEDFCVCSDYFLAHTVKPGNKIAVWNFCRQDKEICNVPYCSGSRNNRNSKPAYLIGHHLKITTIALSNQDHGRFLCSCSDDNIILWDLLQNGGKPSRGKVLLSNVDKPSCCCYSRDDSKLLICFNKVLLLFDLKSMVHVAVEAQPYRIHLCTLSWGENFFTVDESNLCKLWNLPTLEVVNKKYITPSSPCSIAVEQKNKLVAVGTTSGNLYFFNDSGFSLIRSVQIWRVLKNFEKKRTTMQEIAGDESSIYGNESSIPVIALNFYSHKCSNENSDLFLPKVIYIVVITTSCFFLFNINTEEIEFYVNFTEKNVLDGNIEFGLVQSATVYCDDSNHVIHIVLIPLVGNSIILLKIFDAEDSDGCLSKSMRCISISENSCHDDSSESSKCDPLSFLSGCRLFGGHSFLIRKKNHLLTKHPSSLKSGLPSSSSLCQPVSFHKKIKSSGYGLVNKCVMFQPKTISKRSSSSSRDSKCHGASKLLSTAMCDVSNIFSNEKPALLSTVAFSHAPVVTSTHISGNGQYALCGLNDGSVEVLKIGKKNMRQFSTICCHNQSVSSAKWSHSMDLILTSGADKMVKLWRWAKQKHEPVLVVNENNSRKSNLILNGSPKIGELFPDVITNSQFYYLDQFLLVACKNTLYMFEYYLNSRKTDLLRYEKNYSKLIVKVLLSSQRITAFAGVNQFYSNLVLCAGSSKCLDVCDMNTGTVVWHADDVSVKPPYLIALNEGSATVNQPPPMYDIFMTSALFDGIKLWDLRTRRCVLCYKEHHSSSIHCGGAFSACGRYIGAGSEDKSLYIYDLRSASSLHRLTDSTDVITNIVFSPMQPQLLASSIAGKAYLYGQPNA